MLASATDNSRASTRFLVTLRPLLGCYRVLLKVPALGMPAAAASVSDRSGSAENARAYAAHFERSSIRRRSAQASAASMSTMRAPRKPSSATCRTSMRQENCVSSVS